MLIFLRSRVVEVFFGLCLAYWTFALLVPPTTLATMLSGALMAAWLGLLAAYWRGVWRAVREPSSTMGGKLVMIGIAGCALGIVGIFAWSLLYQFLDQPIRMRSHVVRGFLLWIFLVSTIMLLIAGNVGKDRFWPSEDLTRLGIVVAGSIILTVFMIYLVGGFPS